MKEEKHEAMKKMTEKIKKYFRSGFKSLETNTVLVFRPLYRVVSIEKHQHGDYKAVVQVIGKSTVFKMKPEEILADDKMTDQFSPRDVRTLTYLGYLDINSPKYRILAKNLSEKDNSMLFALHKKGEKNLYIKTASEISQNKEIIKQIDQQDAHMIGFMTASDAMLRENIEKKMAISKTAITTTEKSKIIKGNNKKNINNNDIG